MKKLISLALVLVMAFGLLATTALAANPWTKASDWAVPEMERANGQGLIPDTLKNKDLTSNVTRAEFAAVAVKVYENLTGTKATAPAKNPFDDTSDAEVLKAYNTGLMVGVSESKFDPGAILNREQMATALTRVLKRAYIPGWIMQADGDYTLNFAQPSKFADDAATSDWAKPSVYFMFAKEIISGTGGNQFSPKQNATREQSVAIGLRIVEKLKGKPLDYAKSGTENPPSGETSKDLVGKWGGAVSGYEQHRYWFKDDGTYLYRITMLPNIDFDINTAQNIYERGTWRLSEGVVYLTQNYRAYFSLRGKPSETLEWEAIEDRTMHIRFGVHDTIYADHNYLGERYFDNLDQESIFWDVKSPDGYLRLTYNNVPDWVFP